MCILGAMNRRVLSSSALVVALASFAVMGCSKDKKDDADAAPEAAADAAPGDAALDAADAALVDAAVAPLATTAAPVRPKAPVLADPPICQKARAAKQRNSPSFPALEAQCKAAGGTL